MAPRKKKMTVTAIEFDLEGDIAARSRAATTGASPEPPVVKQAANTVAQAPVTPAAPDRTPEQAQGSVSTAAVVPPETVAEAPAAPKSAPKQAAKDTSVAAAATPKTAAKKTTTAKSTPKQEAKDTSAAAAATPKAATKKTTTAKSTPKQAAKDTSAAAAATPKVAAKKTNTPKSTPKQAAKDTGAVAAVTPKAATKKTTTAKSTPKQAAKDTSAAAAVATPKTAAKKTATPKSAPKQAPEPVSTVVIAPETVAKTPAAAVPAEHTSDSKKESKAPHTKKEKKTPQSEPIVAPMPTDAEATQEVVVTKGAPITLSGYEKTALHRRIGVLLLVITVVAASVLIFRFRPMSYDERMHSIQFFYNPAENLTVIAVNGAKRGEAQGALTTRSSDESGEVCAALIGDSLYVVDGRDVVNIAGGVSEFVLSAKGEAVAYRVGNELYYATVGKNDPAVRVTSTAITDEYCLSPDGDHLFFVYEKNGSRQVDIYPSSDKNPYLAETADLTPVGISDNCRYLYYTNAEGKLFVLKGKTETHVLCAEQPLLDTLVFNRDLSEVMLQDGDTTLLFADGERVRMPAVTAGKPISLVANQRVTVRELRTGKQYMMRTFLENYYFQARDAGMMLAFLDGDGKLLDLATVEDISSVTVTDKSVFFLQNEKQDNELRTHLYRCKTGKTEKQALFWDVSDYCANVDGSRILYTNQHGALFSCRIGSDSVHLCDSVVAGSIGVTVDDTFYFYRTEGELWVSDNGEAPRMIRSGVKEFLLDAHTAYYLADCGDTGVGTVFTNHRNQRKDSELDHGFSQIK